MANLFSVLSYDGINSEVIVRDNETGETLNLVVYNEPSKGRVFQFKGETHILRKYINLPSNNLVVSHGVVNAEVLKYHSERISDMLVQKNADYGNSIEQGMNEFGMTYLIIQLQNKINRLKQLSKPEHIAQVKESIADTLDDIAGYAINGTAVEHGHIAIPVPPESTEEVALKTLASVRKSPIKKSKADLLTLCKDLQRYYDESEHVHYSDYFYLIRDIQKLVVKYFPDIVFGELSNMKVKVRKPEQRIEIMHQDVLLSKLDNQHKLSYEDGYKAGTRDEMNHMKEKRVKEREESKPKHINGIDVSKADLLMHTKPALEYFKKYVLPEGKMFVQDGLTFMCYDNKLWLVKENKEAPFAPLFKAQTIIPYNNIPTIAQICEQYLFEQPQESENVQAIKQAMKERTDEIIMSYKNGDIDINELDGVLACFTDQVRGIIEGNKPKAVKSVNGGVDF